MVELMSRGNDENQRPLFLTGLSTDTKPIVWKNGEKIAQGSIFWEIDTWDIYVFNIAGQNWIKKPAEE